MSWTGIYGHYANAEALIKSEFDSLFGRENVIDYYVTNKNPNFRKAIAYVAFQNKDGKVMACVIEINHYKDKFGEEYTYNATTEDVGPYWYDCPKRILDLLDDPYNEYATKWRENCRKKTKTVRQNNKEKLTLDAPL